MMPFNGYGSYLVRFSETTPGDFSLSIRDRDRVRHYRIKRLENGAFFVTSRVIFETIQDLVTYYQQQADGLCVNLIHPRALSNKPQTSNNERKIQDRRKVKLIKKLMDTDFIEVWRGVWNGTTPVAVRIHKPQTMVTAHDFLQTAALMKKLEHPNIIQFYAVCTKEEPMYIITELMKYNSLLEYLCGEGRSTKLPQLIDMAS